MTTFNDRSKGFEAKHAHDAQVNFKINARRNNLLGLWAAEKFGLEDSASEVYAKEVVMSDFEEPGDQGVLRKVLGDFTTKGIELTESELRKKMDDLLIKARDDYARHGLKVTGE